MEPLKDKKGVLAWFAQNHVAANLLMLLIIVGGIISLSTNTVEMFPQMSVDMITVTVPYLGATPAEAEEGVCLRVEEAVAGLACDPSDYAQTLLDVLRSKRELEPVVLYVDSDPAGVVVRRMGRRGRHQYETNDQCRAPNAHEASKWMWGEEHAPPVGCQQRVHSPITPNGVVILNRLRIV